MILFVGLSLLDFGGCSAGEPNPTHLCADIMNDYARLVQKHAYEKHGIRIMTMDPALFPDGIAVDLSMKKADNIIKKEMKNACIQKITQADLLIQPINLSKGIGHWVLFAIDNRNTPAEPKIFDSLPPEDANDRNGISEKARGWIEYVTLGMQIEGDDETTNMGVEITNGWEENCKYVTSTVQNNDFQCGVHTCGNIWNTILSIDTKKGPANNEPNAQKYRKKILIDIQRNRIDMSEWIHPSVSAENQSTNEKTQETSKRQKAHTHFDDKYEDAGKALKKEIEYTRKYMDTKKKKKHKQTCIPYEIRNIIMDTICINAEANTNFEGMQLEQAWWSDTESDRHMGATGGQLSSFLEGRVTWINATKKKEEQDNFLRQAHLSMSNAKSKTTVVIPIFQHKNMDIKKDKYTQIISTIKKGKTKIYEPETYTHRQNTEEIRIMVISNQDNMRGKWNQIREDMNRINNTESHDRRITKPTQYTRYNNHTRPHMGWLRPEAPQPNSPENKIEKHLQEINRHNHILGLMGIHPKGLRMKLIEIGYNKEHITPQNMEKVKSMTRKRTIDILKNYLNEIVGRKYRRGEKIQGKKNNNNNGSTNKRRKEISHTDEWHEKKGARNDRASPNVPGQGSRTPPPPPKSPVTATAET